MRWYALTLDYTAAKWKYASPNHRRSIAEALTDATEVLLTRKPCIPELRSVARLLSRRFYSTIAPPRQMPLTCGYA